MSILLQVLLVGRGEVMSTLLSDAEVKNNLIAYYEGIKLEIRDYESRVIAMKTDCINNGFEPSKLLSKYKSRVTTLIKVKREIEKCLYGRVLYE